MAVRAPLAIVVRSESPVQGAGRSRKGAESKALNYGSRSWQHIASDGLMLLQASKTPSSRAIIAVKRR